MNKLVRASGVPIRFGAIAAAGLLAVFLALPGAAWAAQGKEKRAPGPAEVILKNWNAAGNKLIAMAEDWPEAKYGYRPNDQVRTFAQQLLHAAGANYFAIDAAMGKPLSEVNENPSTSVYKTKAEVVAFVKKSVADGDAAIRQGGDAGALRHLNDWVGIIEHMGEHYGQLVVYYRNNKVVPPASRRHH
jgi:DinB superfamily